MQKIVLKQTDSEIYFDVRYNNKGNRMIRPLVEGTGYESRRASMTDVFVLIFALSRDSGGAHFQTIMASI